MNIINERTFSVCSHKSNKIGHLIFAFVVIVFIVEGCHHMSVVRAYGSWVTDTGGQSIYGVAPISGSSTPEDGTSTDTFTKKILNFCLKLPDGIRNALTGDGYNFSLDGIILGRLAVGSSGNGNSVNYTGFDLSDGNLYGTVGAVIYKTLRAVVLGGMLLIYMYMLASHVFKGGEKSRAELKEALMRLVIMFLLVYIMPQLVDIVIYLRDFTLSLVYKGMTSSGMVDANHMGTNAELITVYRNMAYSESGFGFFTFLLYLGVCVGCIFFLWEYMKVAIIQMMLFGIYPIVALLSVHNKKLFSDWWGMFFSNCLIPVMDYSLLLIPVFIGEAMGEVHPMLSAIMQVAVIAQTVPARNAMLRIFSNATGVATGGGFGGLGMLGMMALAALRKKAFNSGPGENHAVENGEFPDADVSQEMAEQFGKDLRPLMDIGQSIPGEETGSRKSAFETEPGMEDIMSTSDESVKELVVDNADDIKQESADDIYESGNDPAEEVIPKIDNSLTGAEDEGVQKAEEELNTMTENIPGSVLEGNILPEAENTEGKNIGTEPELQTSFASDRGMMHMDDPGRLSEKHQSVSSENNGAGKNNEIESPDRRRGAFGGSSNLPALQQHTMENHGLTGQADTYREPESLHAFNEMRAKNLRSLDSANQQSETLQNKMGILNESHRKNEAVYADRRAAFKTTKNECSIAKTNYELAGKEYGKQSVEVQEAKRQYQSAEKNMREKQEGMEEARMNVRSSQADMDKQKAAIEINRKEIKRAEAKEEHYANIAKQYGMKETRYSSEEEFTRQREIDAIKRNHADYKNFNSSGFRNCLSPEEKAAFSRERQLHERYLKAGRAVNAAAGVAGAVVGVTAGAVIGSFGGEKGMRNGAMIGGLAGGSASAGTASIVGRGMQGEAGLSSAGGTRAIGDVDSADSVSTEKVRKGSVKSGKEKSVPGHKSKERLGAELDRRAKSAVQKDADIRNLL